MSFINDFLSLIYPRRCEACESLLYAHEHLVCKRCRLTLPKSNYQEGGSSELDKLFYGRVPLIHAWSFYLFEKSGRVQKLLHAIKYQDQKDVATLLGRMFGEHLLKKGQGTEPDLLLPVPLHAKKLRRRGYNQSEYFAKGLSETLLKPMEANYLIRVIETETQTHKHKYQRWENVEGIFQCTNEQALYGKHVLLVDDVITTGATIEAAYQALKNIEGLRISVASIAFAAKLQ